MTYSIIGMIGVWEIIIILVVLATAAAVVLGIVLLAIWLSRREKTPPPGPTPAPPPAPAPMANCPKCGRPLPSGAPEGLCPRCALEAGLATQTDEAREPGPQGTKVVTHAPSAEEIAHRFPQLDLLECLGRGGMGVVYKARQPKLNRTVALKILAPEKAADPRFAERFSREAQALARLNHPSIVTVHDFGETDGMFFLLMEYVDGANLRQLMQQKRLKPEEALAIVPKICEALQFAHEQGVVHRDIKPENVLIDKLGRVKIADFGIAKIMGQEAAAAGLTQDQVIGTPHYMAPEQVEQPQLVDHRADIYSLGVVFYEMLTGELPLGKFALPSHKLHLDVRLDEIVLHALEKKPELRYQQASEVKTDVEAIVGTAPPPPGHTGRISALAANVSALAEARKRVSPPAIGLLVAGGLNLAIPFVIALYSVTLAVEAAQSRIISLGPLVALFFLACVIIAGASQMKRLASYRLAITACILAVLLPPGALVGLPFGIWALVVLSQPEVRRAFQVNDPGRAANKRYPPRWLTTAALSSVVFFAGVELGALVLEIFPGRNRILALVGLMVVATPFVAVLAHHFSRRWQAAAQRRDPGALVWLKACAWSAWILAIPALAFGLFFLNALITETGPWNPVTDEAVLVPLTWLGALLLPISGSILHRAAVWPAHKSWRDDPAEHVRLTAIAGSSPGSGCK